MGIGILARFSLVVELPTNDDKTYEEKMSLILIKPIINDKKKGGSKIVEYIKLKFH